MKLVSRVSVFFLAALAIVLGVTSAAFYVFVRAQMVQQFELELHDVLHSLVAAVEIEPDDVSWQPQEHVITYGDTEGPNAVAWVVIGDGDRVIEKSPTATPDLIAQAQALASRPAGGSQAAPIRDSGTWHILHQRLAASKPDAESRDSHEFDAIVIVAARAAAPLNSSLQRLLWVACALPVGIWLLAAAAGYGFCRRALRPVWDMSQQARSMTGGNFHSRLSVPQTGDELAELASAFNQLLDSQQQALEQQRRFTGDAAHELRTPLTVLLGQIDVALRRPRSPQEYDATLRTLRDETAQLRAIVESLLFLARAKEEAALPDAETFSLTAWLPDYMARWKEHPRHGDIHLDVHTNGQGDIRMSRALLTRLLDNLLENALKYSSPGSRVEVISTSDDAGLQIAVQDQGRGIAAEDQAKIFEPFFRSRSARDAGIDGVGLGLAISARIAAASGGKLACTSEMGRGSRFTLRLPTASRPLPGV